MERGSAYTKIRTLPVCHTIPQAAVDVEGRSYRIDYEIRGWKPALVEHVEAHSRKHKIYVYEIAKK